MIIAIQIMLKYALLQPFNVGITLNWFGFALLVLATLCIASAGYIINDINDVDTDTINAPDDVIVGNTISEKTAYTLFIIFNIVGVVLGFYLSHLVGKSGFFAIFVIVSILLYLYATYLKQMLIVGNLLVAGLVAFTILIVGLFELFPAITESNFQTQQTFFRIMLDYAFFAFLLTLAREVAKDLQDYEGDKASELNTLAVYAGKAKGTKILFVLILLPIAAVTYYILTYLYKQQIAVFYFLILILAPLIYTAIKSFNAKRKKQYSHISIMLKLIMVTGIFSLLIFKYILL
ncbi:4-hydroxybenzoate polyprenyltransferase [Flavobacteriaceae bacterium MAR_2010_188]|nr:4-hydroxybenzoate polyprenyltransferase [Flavobacteriaceae bacterium MAR_2010_188]